MRFAQRVSGREVALAAHPSDAGSQRARGEPRLAANRVADRLAHAAARAEHVRENCGACAERRPLRAAVRERVAPHAAREAHLAAIGRYETAVAAGERDEGHAGLIEARVFEMRLECEEVRGACVRARAVS